MAKGFELLDIATADMAFEAYGSDISEMFANAGRALMSVMFDLKTVAKKEKRHIELSAPETTTLLHDFLHEILFTFETEQLIFKDFRVETDGRKLSADLFGEKFDPKKHRFIIDVKAITYHNMEIAKKNGTWRCQVVVDV